MIKFHVTGDNVVRLECRGTAMDMVAEITYLVRDVYRHFTEASPTSGNNFKTLIQMAIADDESPVWERGEATGDAITKVEIRLPGMGNGDGSV